MDWSHGRRKEEHRGLLWIRGKPGSGKSTLMRTIYENATEIAATNPDMLVVTFFFNARAKDELEKSSIGMYRSIIHQVLEQMPSQRAKFAAGYRDKLMRDTIDDWTIPDLQVFLRHIVGDLRGQSLAILLDALDEAEEKDVRALVTFMEDLCRIATENETSLQACLSSRHYPFIRIRNGSITLVLESEEEHSRDIVNYIDNWLSKYHEPMPDLQAELVRQAKGVFLWVSLAIQQLEYLHDNGDQDAMLERVKHIPSRLDDLFSELLKTNTNNMDETIILLQWMLYARDLPHPTLLYTAVKVGTQPHLASGKMNIPKDETVRQFLLNRSKGLVEVVAAGDNGSTGEVQVHFIHETVQSFLSSSKGLPELRPELNKNLLGLSHDKLRGICGDYLSKQLISQMPRHSRLNWAVQSPYIETWWNTVVTRYSQDKLGWYACLNLFQHAELAEAAGVSQSMFLDEISTMTHGFLVKLLSRDRYLKTSSIVDLVVAKNNFALARSLMTPQTIIGISPKRKGELFHLAVTEGSYDVCRLLLDCGIDPNVYNEEYGSALNAAIYHSQHNITRLLLNRGADVNIDTMNGGTALITAALHESMDVVELLIGHGADVNLRSSAKGLTIDAILKVSNRSRRHLGMLSLLLRHGAERPTDPYLAHKLQGKSQL
jgi:hypothetical protein